MLVEPCPTREADMQKKHGLKKTAGGPPPAVKINLCLYLRRYL